MTASSCSNLREFRAKEELDQTIHWAAFYLNDGIVCGRRAATQTLLSGFSCGLDDRGLQLDPSRYEYSPLPADSQRPRVVGLFVHDRSFGLVWVNFHRWGQEFYGPVGPPSVSRHCCRSSQLLPRVVPDHLSCLEVPFRQCLPLVRSNADQPTLIASAACSKSQCAQASIKKGRFGNWDFVFRSPVAIFVSVSGAPCTTQVDLPAKLNFGVLSAATCPPTAQFGRRPHDGQYASVRVSRRPDFLRSPPGTQIQRFTYRW